MPDLAAEKPQTLWRAYVPRWAHAPLSGDGAARFGGRWNPIGAATIYAANELSTAWAEYNQGFVQHPALIAQLRLLGARLADLTDEKLLRENKIDPAIHECQWRDELDQAKVPETHAVRKKLLADGYDGVVYPSFMSPGGSCVALWRWNSPGMPTVKVIDPEGRLPRDADRGCEEIVANVSKFRLHRRTAPRAYGPMKRAGREKDVSSPWRWIVAVKGHELPSPFPQYPCCGSAWRKAARR